MAKTVPLIDTSVFIEALRGNKKMQRALCGMNGFYYPMVVRKELWKKRNLSVAEEKEIEKYLSKGKAVFIDTSILEGVRVLAPLFRKKQIADSNDIIIAATAMVKNLPLITLNKKHFSFIKGLKLVSL